MFSSLFPSFKFHGLVLAQPRLMPVAPSLNTAATRTVIKPAAILDVLRRRGRSLGLSAQYEESRLGLHR